MDLPIKMLTTAVAVPVFGAFLIPFAGRVSSSARNAFAVLLGLFTFAAAASLLSPVLGRGAVDYVIAFPRGFDLILHADLLSVFMATVSSFVSAVILIYSLDYISHYENQTEYYTMVVLFLGSMKLNYLGVFFACVFILGIATSIIIMIYDRKKTKLERQAIAAAEAAESGTNT